MNKHFPCGHWHKKSEGGYTKITTMILGDWWQQALGLYEDYIYFSLMSEDNKVLYYIRYKINDRYWELINILEFPKVVSGFTVTETHGLQGCVEARSNFAVFLNEIYMDKEDEKGYLISVRFTHSENEYTTIPYVSTDFRGSEKALVVYDNGTILAAFLASNKPNVLKSIDYGATWTLIVLDTIDDGHLKLAHDVVNDIVYAVAKYGVYKSVNSGSTWTKTASGNFGYFDVCFKGGVLYIVGGSCGTVHTMWKYINGVFSSSMDVPYTYFDPNLISTSTGLILYEPSYREFGTPYKPFLLTSLDAATWTARSDLSIYTMPYPYNNSISSFNNRVAFTSCGMGEDSINNPLSLMYSDNSWDWTMIRLPFEGILH